MSGATRRGHRPRAGTLGQSRGGDPHEGPAAGGDGSLLAAIAAGKLDPHLPALARAIDARLHLLHTIESIDALAGLVVGDHVRINHHARPRYLEGLHATVIDLDDRAATISLQRPIGRFASGKIRCPPLVLDRLGPGPG
jgi:hypothetical protein